jgi:ATP-dependent RNA helicase RhlE
MGFIGAVKQIAGAIGAGRRTAMFSATMGEDIAKLAKGLLNDPVRVEVAAPATTVPLIVQRAIFANAKEKRDQLNTLLGDAALSKVIIFSRTKHGADRVTKNLKIDGHAAAAIHGNKSQNARQAALKAFSSGNVRILVATDIAARGIDVPNISHVINYELPDDPESYVHRIGRTARNGASGISITLVSGEERGKLRDIERLIRRTLPLEGDRPTAAGAPAQPRHERSGPAKPRGGRGNGHRPNGPGRPSGAPKARPAAGASAKAAHDRAGLNHGGQKVGQAKPRWTTKRKTAAAANRTVKYGGSAVRVPDPAVGPQGSAAN